jgi:hypothetical protein
MKVEKDNCRHAIGTAEVEYQMDVIHEGSSTDAVHEDSFRAYTFCPYCGENVVNEAMEFEQKCSLKWREFWVDYAKMHGDHHRQKNDKTFQKLKSMGLLE